MHAVLLVALTGLAVAADPAARATDDVLRKSWETYEKSLDAAKIAKDYAGAVQNLKSTEADKQLAGLATLSATGEIDAIPLLVPLLDSADARVRIYAGSALEKLVSGVALKRRDPAKLDRVALLPRGAKDPDLRPLAWVVLQMLRKPDDGNTHAYAATMIRYLELNEFEPELRQLLQSRHPAVSNKAKWALEELGFKIPNPNR